jgi:hypothetical protein
MFSKEKESHLEGNADFNAIAPGMDSSMQNELTSKSSMVNDVLRGQKVYRSGKTCK